MTWYGPPEPTPRKLDGGKMKIYLASRWSRQAILRQVRGDIFPHVVTSRWIDAERPEIPGEEFFLSDEGRLRFENDIIDIGMSDILVADTLGGMGRRGGMMMEIGYAYGLGKPVMLVGNPATFGVFGNIFSRVFVDWHSAICLNFGMK